MNQTRVIHKEYIINDVLLQCPELTQKTVFYHTKVGDLLVSARDITMVSFVEDSILRYKSLVRGGLMIPTIGSTESGGRVYDSFTLMPSWIRSLVKVNGHKMVEVDYSCLHPNISMTLYGGQQKYITHQQVSADTKLPLAKVKKEHLSFFNQDTKVINHSALFAHYKALEPIMIERLVREKKEHGYTITSKRLMSKEVELMTAVIKALNAEGIYVGYIYDALFTEPKHAERVVEVMNKVVVDMGVFTRAKSAA